MGRLEGWNSACVSVRTWIKIPKIHVMPDAVMGICRAGIAKPTVEEERSQSPGTYKQAILEYAIDSSLGLMDIKWGPGAWTQISHQVRLELEFKMKNQVMF